MAHVRTANTKELEATPGYVGDGLSMWTHKAARARRAARKPITLTLTTRQMIAQQERALRELYRKHRETRDETQLIRLRRDIDAKQNFLTRLWADLAGRARKP